MKRTRKITLEEINKTKDLGKQEQALQHYNLKKLIARHKTRSKPKIKALARKEEMLELYLIQHKRKNGITWA